MRFTLSLAALLTLTTGCLPPLPPATVNFGPVDDTGEDTAVDETGDTAEDTAETGDSADSDSDSAVETGDTEVFEITGYSVTCGNEQCEYVVTTNRDSELLQFVLFVGEDDYSGQMVPSASETPNEPHTYTLRVTTADSRVFNQDQPDATFVFFASAWDGTTDCIAFGQDPADTGDTGVEPTTNYYGCSNVDWN